MIYFILLKIFKKFLAKPCRPLYCIIFGRARNDYKVLRYVLRFICGVFFAWLLWQMILSNSSFSLKSQILLLIILITTIGAGCMFSTFTQCVMLLIIVGMTGKAGRSYLRAISFSFIISGPIANLANNGQEVARVFSCTVALQYNLTKTRFDLMAKPFQRTLATMKDDFKDIKQGFSFIENVTNPLRDEIENDDLTSDTYSEGHYKNRQFRQPQDRAMQVQRRYSQKMEQRCKEQLKRGEDRCKRAFFNAREKCMKKFPHIINTMLCWPFRVDFVCTLKMLGDPDKICDPSDALPSEFGEAYVALDVTKSKIVSDESNLVVNYTVRNVAVPPGLMKADDVAKSVMRDIEKKKNSLDYAMNILQRCLSFLFIRVIIIEGILPPKISSVMGETFKNPLNITLVFSVILICVNIFTFTVFATDFYCWSASVLYQKNYCSRIQHDNIYITEYFKHVDRRRKQIGKRTLMPLKKFERKDLVDLGKLCSHSKNEYKEMIFHFLQFSMEIIAAGFFLLLDYVIVSVMLSIRAHSKVRYVQNGEHKIRFHIKGTGLVAKLIRSTLRNFNMHAKVHTSLSNAACLPNPRILPLSFYIKMGILYLSIIVLIYKSSLFLRLRRLVCAWFYRKHEKQRILFLYNKLRRLRRTLFERMYENVKSNITEQKIRRQVNFLLVLRLRYPKCFNWLKFFKLARHKCLVCKEFEDDRFVICSNSECGSVYCDECWHDIKSNCLCCNQPIKVITILNFHDFFEDYTVK